MPAAAFTPACPRCKFQPQSFVNNCPQCGQIIVSPERIRKLGWLLIVIGTLLTLGMVFLSVTIARIISNSGDPNATTGYTGDAGHMVTMFMLFGLVAVFGVVAIVAGSWQVRHGTRNPRLVAAAFFILTVLMGLMAYIQIAM